MSLNETPSANRTHIGFFGCRNAGKSSLLNAVTGQEIAIVSHRPGTTTDPVKKAMELLPLGPVMLIDTAGYDDDEADVGNQRVLRTKRVLNQTDLAVLVVDGTRGLSLCDKELEKIFQEKEIPYLLVYNKADEMDALSMKPMGIRVSAKTGEGIGELRERLAAMAPKGGQKPLLSDLLEPQDWVVLVTPIDESAPKGRMILPQVQTLRDVLDADAVGIVTKETELAEVLQRSGKIPKLVVTDSQAFAYVAKVVPPEIPLTSFSILMARQKGFLETAVRGVAKLRYLKDGDTVLIAEGCTHHRQCNDIGTVKIPRWLQSHYGKQIAIETCSGTEFPQELSRYAAVLHCGGCMLTSREVLYRMKCAIDQGVPFLNYGVLIAEMTGILHRSLSLFPDLQALLEE